MSVNSVAAPRAYAQWAALKIGNDFKSDDNAIEIRNVTMGKIYKDGNKDKEIPPSQVNGKKIPPQTTHSFETCGRSDAASGTEGTLELWDGSQRICKLYWDCPWGSKVNKFEVQEKVKAYRVEVGSWNSYGGALGNVDVEISRK
ncbi:aegerolysin family protein [Aspergillus novofumigatus IBT 16806]|uniref:Aegerolysin family protein n=1 Tax=Aspergillus novofumigatus (strain IBT 16806) TaxID=1392255 RepID=A0A2I1BSU3_ASPN1|nr:Aegerolysin family protein [Aspergillus novofumigatus IBT 16806]PKX88449.1 Aegerolysin family protein [Aspergillus novofumigatus IBT 16806]